MKVQLLESWLLKEQAKMQITYLQLNQISQKEPDIIFIGDSIIEYYPIHELFNTSRHMVNRGIRGYKTSQLKESLDVHLFGTAVDKIFLLIGTNDIGNEIAQFETVENMASILQTIQRDFPLTQVKLLSVLPVNESPVYKDIVYIRTNKTIHRLNQELLALTQAYINVEFIDIYSKMLDLNGQLPEEFTTDGLHLTIQGYQVLSKYLQIYL